MCFKNTPPPTWSVPKDTLQDHTVLDFSFKKCRQKLCMEGKRTPPPPPMARHLPPPYTAEELLSVVGTGSMPGGGGGISQLSHTML